MATTSPTTEARNNWSGPFDPYEQWIQRQGAPIHSGYYIDDGKTVDLGWWAARECNAAFLQLEGQQGVTGVYITEIAPGKTLPPFRMGIDEAVYVLEGRGIATLQDGEGRTQKSFEWQKHSMFLLPGGFSCQFSNVQGTQPARLLHHNYLPLALTCAVPEPGFFLDNPRTNRDRLMAAPGGEFYSEARAETITRMGAPRNAWAGNFFPDMRAWDRLDPLRYRGAGGQVVWVLFPGSPITAHMSVFPPLTYKKAHRHGPGYVIVIPAGEGYSIMWPDGGEKVVIPWREGTIFVPPNRWFHQHFNVSSGADRYLALHPPRPLMMAAETIEDLSRDQIEDVKEDPWVRRKVEEELAARGLQSRMEAAAYRNADHQWQEPTLT